MSVKKEVSEDHRKFNSNQEERYFFANKKDKPQRLVRMQAISIPEELSKEA